MDKQPLEKAFEVLKGPAGVSRALATHGITITAWACSKWLKAGKLPRTEYTGETNYAAALERATEIAGDKVAASDLLEAGRARPPLQWPLPIPG